MAPAHKKEKLTMYRLREKLLKHGFDVIDPGKVIEYVMAGKTVVCVFPEKKKMDFWMSMFWHTSRLDKSVGKEIVSITKKGIEFTKGRVVTRVMSPDYEFFGYGISDTVIAFFMN